MNNDTTELGSIMKLMGEAAERLEKLKNNTTPSPYARLLAVGLTLLQQSIAWLGYYAVPAGPVSEVTDELEVLPPTK